MSIVWLEHKWLLLVPKQFLFWLRKNSTHEVNVRMLVDIFIKDYQIANAMDANASWNHNLITETFLYVAEIALRLDSYFIHLTPTSFTSIISLKNKLTLIREHHKGPFYHWSSSAEFSWPTWCGYAGFVMNHDVVSCLQAEYVTCMYAAFVSQFFMTNACQKTRSSQRTSPR